MPRLVFDIKAQRPGCALMQAVMGGDLGIANRFPSESWLIDSSSGNNIADLICYQLTDAQLDGVTATIWKRYNAGYYVKAANAAPHPPEATSKDAKETV